MDIDIPCRLQETDYLTPLIAAIKHGHMDAVKFLISKGADINFDNASHGPPLPFCYEYGDKSISDFLIEQGAYIVVCSKDYERLINDVKNSELELVELKVTSGINVYVKP